MKHNSKILDYSNRQISALTILRVLIGWHFLYEGLVKIYTPGWSAKSYLLNSVGPFSSFFKSIAQSNQILNIADTLNEWGLILIGLSLFVGLFSKFSSFFGILLLAFYYLSYPPFANLGIEAYVEGNYWIVNRNLIEIAALLVLVVFPSSHITGIDRFIFLNRKKKSDNSPS
ncbi:DoxX family membrane protein [Proteiniphilum sp.]|uniref:DoxX family membrane protein n=1 Tax=Proteiniphilum sp. TaxID=1926877 RepID=UPI003330E207